TAPTRIAISMPGVRFMPEAYPGSRDQMSRHMVIWEMLGAADSFALHRGDVRTVGGGRRLALMLTSFALGRGGG
ncbi:MAG TPA: hypothetical protein VGQ80_17300, partial [Acidimicrobiia bacterium]|nr:hypothetical protein [Acidimicrobiia bacterium]